jgi:hypothetical protein
MSVNIRDDAAHYKFQNEQAGTTRRQLSVDIDIAQQLFDLVREIADKLALSESLLEDMTAFFRDDTPPEERFDSFKIITLYKTGQGPNWLVDRKRRQYIRVTAPVATAVNVTSSLGSPFVLTIPAMTLPNMWNEFDLPEMSSIILDSTATANSMNIYVRYTNIAPQY